MRNLQSRTAAACAAIAIVCAAGLATPAVAGDNASIIEQGKALAFDARKGNCLACHAIAGGELPGDIGPALIMMGQRYPDKTKLRAQIFDATKNNPATVMPPFGRNAILTTDELNEIVEFISTL